MTMLKQASFNENERETIKSKFTEIKTYKDEMLDKFITGNLNIPFYINHLSYKG